jgi:hypothetical protein
MGAAIGVVLELPEMHELIDRPGVGLKIADQVFVVPALQERWIPKFLVQLDGLGQKNASAAGENGGSGRMPENRAVSISHERRIHPWRR